MVVRRLGSGVNWQEALKVKEGHKTSGVCTQACTSLVCVHRPALVYVGLVQRRIMNTMYKYEIALDAKVGSSGVGRNYDEGNVPVYANRVTEAGLYTPPALSFSNSRR